MNLKFDPLSSPYPDAAAVKLRVDLVAFVAQFSRLRRRGRQWVGRCPLHDDRRPSLYVHPGRQVFHCFGCGSGGDVYSLVMKKRGCSFPEAVRIVAEFARVGSPPKAKPEAGFAPTKSARPDSWATPQRGEPKPLLVDSSPRDLPPCFFAEIATRADVLRYQRGETAVMNRLVSSLVQRRITGFLNGGRG
jgi:hypothetical protein